MKNNNDSVNRFWDNFRNVVIEQGVDQKYADLYVEWGEKFALSIKGKTLRERNLDDIKGFISKIKNQKNVQEWKVKQAREALYILYYKYLDYIACDRHVRASTQSLALNAIVFMYAQVLKRDPGDFSDFYRAKRGQKIPVVLAKEEVDLLLDMAVCVSGIQLEC